MNKINIRKSFKWNDVCIFMSLLYLISIILFTYSTTLIKYSEIIFLILIFTVFIEIIKNKKIPKSKLYLFLSLFILWFIVVTFWAVNETTHLMRLKTLLQLVLLSVCYFLIYREEYAFNKFITIFLIAGYSMCFYALYIYGGVFSFISMMSIRRLGTEINQANIFGYYASLTVCFSYYLALYKEKYIFYFLMGLPFLMALSSGSKRSLLLILFGIILLAYFKNRNKKFGKTIIYISIISLCIFLILKLPIFSVINERMQSIFNLFDNSGKIDSSTIKRQSFIQEGWNLFINKPFIGYGLNSFTYISQYTYSHNNYIEMLVNGGIIGFLLYYILVVIPTIRLFKSTLEFDSISTLFFVLLCISFVNDIAAVSYYFKMQYIIIGVSFACSDSKSRAKFTKNNKKLKGIF